MTRPLISCIVPTFNGGRYLAEALDSILAQTYRPLEIVVADDGSTDGTISTVASYGDLVRLVRQRTAGPAATRNLGLQAATGVYVAFLDADDLWRPEKLALQMERFIARSELDLCIAHVQMFWTEDLAEERAYYRDHPRSRPLPGYATTTLLARREIFTKVGEFDARLWFGDATDWFMRAIEHGAVVELLPNVLTYHRMHPFNLTRRRSEASREEFLHIVKASLDRRRSGITHALRSDELPQLKPTREE
jgi:glycosyltransferase involved in cell wall biosynthesis